MNLEFLNGKTIIQLRELAKDLGVKSVTKYKKEELIELLMSSPEKKEVEVKEVKEVKNPVVPNNQDKVEGVLELVEQQNFGFLRFDNFLTSKEDVYVSPSQIRRFNMKTGDLVTGITRKPKDNEKFRALLYVRKINGDDPDVAAKRPKFDTLTPTYPDERFRLERSHSDLSMRLIDLIAPIGKGQRGLIVAPPKAGKTIILQKIAQSIATNYPDTKLIVLLIIFRSSLSNL